MNPTVRRKGLMLRSVFRKMIDSRLPQNEPWILYEAIKLYGKNAATALLFSVFMMLFPYLHFVLLHNNAPLHICAVLISAGAFISSNLLYAPFIASVHRRKTSSQKKLAWNRISMNSLQWALVHGVLFSVFVFLLRKYPEHASLFKIFFPILLFSFFQITLFRTAFIITESTLEKTLKTSLFFLFLRQKALFVETFLLNIALFFSVPYFTEQYFLSEFSIFSEWPSEKQLSYARYMPIVALFFIFSLPLISSYVCIKNATETYI